MKNKKLLGYLLVLIPFLIIALLMYSQAGIEAILLSFGITAIIIFFIVLGVYLINDES